MTKWLIVVGGLWLWFVLCAHWEPVVFDSWGHFLWHRDVGLSPAHLVDFAHESYVHWNPRLGELFTLLSFTPGAWHVVFTPVMELATLYAVTWAALGKKPDPVTYALTAALVLVCLPEAGSVLFYRPFAWNFVFALGLAAAFVIPYRVAEGTRWWMTPAMALLGFAAGLGAEHTGPALIAIAIAVMVARRRAAPWMIAGAVMVLVGWLALVLAPAQLYKYGGLAAHETPRDLLGQRGLLGNLKVIYTPIVALAPALVPLGLALWARRRGDRPAIPRALLVGAAIAALVTVVLLASPKQGPRLTLAPIAIASAVIAAFVSLHASVRRAVAIVTAVTLVVAALWCLRISHTRGGEWAERLAILEHATPNGRAELPHYTIGRTHWSLRDDLDEDQRRNYIAYKFGLALLVVTK